MGCPLDIERGAPVKNGAPLLPYFTLMLLLMDEDITTTDVLLSVVVIHDSLNAIQF